MANADELCQFARLGQTAKIQKCLQAQSVDINALNLYGESALATATYYNQILCVQYLLANKADPLLRLSAGHTAVHIACRMGNVPILHMLLNKKIDVDNTNSTIIQSEEGDKLVYDCLRMKDRTGLTPIHWAAAQESVSKRQKMFAYLDKRLPGVLDSRYNLDWFKVWAKTHAWVTTKKTKTVTTVLPNETEAVMKNTDNVYRDRLEVTPLMMTPRTSMNDYQRTPRPPAISNQYDNVHEQQQRRRSSDKLRAPRVVQIDHHSEETSLPPTPITSCKVTVTSIYHLPKNDYKFLTPPKLPEHRDLPRTQKEFNMERNTSTPPLSQRTPYSQQPRSTIREHPFSPISDRCTYRAHRVQVEPMFEFPPPPPEITNNKGHDYEDMPMTPLSSKRPSHNLLSNIAPPTTTPSSDHSSRQSTKPFAASFGFDTSIEPAAGDITTLSTADTYAQDDEHGELQSLSSDDENDYESNQCDYLCKSTSTLGISSPGAHTYYA